MSAILGICTRNNADTIRKQLEIIIAQTCKPDEILFVDSSTDETPRIIREILNPTDINYKIIKQKGVGVGDARQEIFEYSKKNNYDIIIFLDTGKYPMNLNWIKYHLDFHERYDYFAILNGRIVKQDYEPRSPFNDVNYLIQCNCSIKLDYLEKAGGYDRKFKRGEDWDVAIRLFRIGARSFVSCKVAADESSKEPLKSFLKKKLNRSPSLKFLRKYGFWYLKNYPQHFIADFLGVSNLLSLVSLPLFPQPAAILYGLSLLAFNAGIYKSNKNIIKDFKASTVLLPLIYGLSVFKNLP